MGKERATRVQVIARVGFLLGLVLLMGSFVMEDIRSQGWMQAKDLSTTLWLAGAALVLAGAAYNWRALARAFARRRTAEGANLGLTVVLALSLVALLCYISTRRFARLDWTGKRKYTLYSQTRNILRGLDRDVEAVVIAAQMEDPRLNMAMDSALDILQEFRSETTRVTVREVNFMLPEGQAEVENLRQRLGEQPDVPSVVFVTANSHEIVPLGKVVGVSERGFEFAGEDAFAGALKKLTEGQKGVVYFLAGHGEWAMEAAEPQPMQPEQDTAGAAYSLSRMVGALKRDNYEVKPLNLAGEVPADCSVLIIAGPKAPLPEAELKALRAYLADRNGAAVVLMDPVLVAGAATNLGEVLADYGVRVRTDAVGMTVLRTALGSFISHETPVWPEEMARHDVTTGLQNYKVVLSYACPLEVIEETGDTTAARKLLTGPEEYWGERDYRPDSREAPAYDSSRDVAPPLVLGAVVEPAGPPPPGMIPPQSAQGAQGPRIVVIGSARSFVNAVVEGEPANLYLVENAVNWMAGKLHMLGIPPRTLEYSPTSVSAAQIAAARYAFIGVLPACIIALGIGIWILRRR
jgi:hypothetical protein